MAIPENVQQAIRHIFVESDIVTDIAYQLKEECGGWEEVDEHPDNVAVQTILVWIKRETFKDRFLR